MQLLAVVVLAASPAAADDQDSLEKKTDIAIARGLNPIGNLLSVGNMDTNRGDRCRGDHDPCGLLGKVRYRNFQWGS